MKGLIAVLVAIAVVAFAGSASAQVVCNGAGVANGVAVHSYGVQVAAPFAAQQFVAVPQQTVVAAVQPVVVANGFANHSLRVNVNHRSSLFGGGLLGGGLLNRGSFSHRTVIRHRGRF